MAVGDNGFHDPVHSLLFFFGAGRGVSLFEKVFQRSGLRCRGRAPGSRAPSRRALVLLLLLSFRGCLSTIGHQRRFALPRLVRGFLKVLVGIPLA